MSLVGTGSLPIDLAQHRAYARVFQPGRLTFGFIAPLEGYPDSPAPTLEGHAALARQAEALGFAAIWLRDVPFLDPSFGDVGQIHDPMVYAGWLAAITQYIAIGTAGMVMTLRDPVLVAKQAASVDQLSGGQLLLGLSTGDRATEYPALAQSYDNRAERYREAHALLRVVTEQHFPLHQTAHYGRLDGNLVPKPGGGRLPTLAIGRCGVPPPKSWRNCRNTCCRSFPSGWSMRRCRTPERPRHDRPHIDGMWGAAWLVTAVFMLSNSPTPLYVHWQQKLGFSTGTLTVIFALYIAGLLGTLLMAGQLSDRYGRKPVLLPGLLAVLTACLLFAGAQSVLTLGIARLLTGIALGVMVSAGMAAVGDLGGSERRRQAALLASVSMVFGAGQGPLLAGGLAQTHPAKRSY